MENRKYEKHGLSGTRIYLIWADMKARCINSNNPEYKNYGGRGITYDPRWEYFINFYEEMNSSYSDTLTLDRINPNGNYCKDNCRWITKGAQGRNQRMRVTNKSGYTGVYLKIDRRNKIYKYWTSMWYEDGGKIKYKYFSIKKYGYSKAYNMAVKFRENKIKELILKGYEYTDFHGK